MKRLRRLRQAGLLLALSALALPAQQVTLNERRNLPFARGSASLQQAEPALTQLAAWLAAHPECIVELQGSADDHESRSLANAREQAVAEFLINHGISLSHIRIIGYGATPPPGSGKRAVSIMVIAAQSPSVAAVPPPRVTTLTLPHVTAPSPAPPPPPPASIDSVQSDQIVNRGRNFLTGKEPAGYGLYSYLIFTTRARNEDEKARYKDLVTAFLNLNDIAKVEQAMQEDRGSVDRKRLHLALLPVYQAPAEPDPAAVLEAYNYERAGVLLRDLPKRPGTPADGAYFVWSLTPLSGGHAANAMQQDLNAIPPGDLIAAWYRTLLEKAEAPRQWQHRTLKEYALQVQTSLESLSRRVPSAQQAIVASLTFFDAGSWKHPGKEK